MENGMWEEKPFSRGQAWIDLLMLAAHKDKEFYFDNAILSVEKGEIITSKRKLGIRWGWSNSKVDKFLDELEKVKMLTKKSDTKKTTIKITHYGQYQAFNASLATEKTTQKAASSNHVPDTFTTHSRTYNNIKNNKNVKKEKNIWPSANFSPSGDLPPNEDKEYDEMCKRLDELKRRKQNW